MSQLSDPAYALSLRLRAEEILTSSCTNAEQLPLKDLQSLVHELQVHQIELQMQNEELRDTQIRLQDSQNNFKELYELAPVGYLTVDTKNIIQTTNLNACDLFGLNPATLAGTRFAKHFAAEDQEDIHLTFRHLIASNEKQSLDCRALNQTEHIWIHMECSVRASNPSEWLVTLTDISRLKRTEELLHEQERQLAHVARISYLDEMAGGIAHEVAQPLSAISVSSYSCELILAQGSEDQTEQLMEMIQMITEQAIHAGEILKRLRSFVKPSNVIHEALDVNIVIREALRLTASQTKASHTKIHLGLADNLPCVDGDKVQIHQVIVNLLLNALESMTHEAPEERLIILRSSFTKGSVEVSVEDHGEGLSAEAAATVFDAFVTTKTAGMGLGLAISRSIIESHRGKIWVTTKPYQGARFHFKLPVKAEITKDE